MLVGICGLPASGKTTAMRELEEKKDFESHMTGDIVREMARDDLGEDYNDDELGEWSTERRESDPAYATREAIRRIKNSNTDDEKYIIEGFRCKEEIELIKDNFDDHLIIYVHAPFDERYERTQDRGREGEENKTEEEFRTRDERELGWGMEEIINKELYDVKINADKDIDSFRNEVLEIYEKHQN